MSSEKNYWVVAHVHYDYEYCDFQLEGFKTKEQVESFILTLLQRRYDDEPMYSPDCIHVIKGSNVKFTTKAVEIEKVKLK